MHIDDSYFNTPLNIVVDDHGMVIVIDINIT